MFFWVTVPNLSFPLWEDEVMEKIGKALGKFIGFIEVTKMVASSIKQEYMYNNDKKNALFESMTDGLKSLFHKGYLGCTDLGAHLL